MLRAFRLFRLFGKMGQVCLKLRWRAGKSQCHTGTQNLRIATRHRMRSLNLASAGASQNIELQWNEIIRAPHAAQAHCHCRRPQHCAYLAGLGRCPSPHLAHRSPPPHIHALFIPEILLPHSLYRNLIIFRAILFPAALPSAEISPLHPSPLFFRPPYLPPYLPISFPSSRPLNLSRYLPFSLPSCIPTPSLPASLPRSVNALGAKFSGLVCIYHEPRVQYLFVINQLTSPSFQLIGLIFIFTYALFGLQFFADRSEVSYLRFDSSY